MNNFYRESYRSRFYLLGKGDGKMKCDSCGSETPPHYQHGLMTWICHTCKALGRIIEGVWCPDAGEPEMLAPDQEQATQPEESTEATAELAPDQTDGDPGKRKTKKLKP